MSIVQRKQQPKKTVPNKRNYDFFRRQNAWLLGHFRVVVQKCLWRHFLYVQYCIYVLVRWRLQNEFTSERILKRKKPTRRGLGSVEPRDTLSICSVHVWTVNKCYYTNCTVLFLVIYFLISFTIFILSFIVNSFNSSFVSCCLLFCRRQTNTVYTKKSQKCIDTKTCALEKILFMLCVNLLFS